MAKLSDIIIYDTTANIPAAGVEGRLFYSTDDDTLFRDNGSTWDELVIAAGSASSVDWDDVDNKPADFTPSSHNHDWADITSGVPTTFAPTTHASSHASAGSDSIKLDDLAAPDDNTDLNVSTSAHGLFPKLPGGTTNFYREDGTWQPLVSGVDATVLDLIVTDANGNVVVDANGNVVYGA